VAMDLSGVAAFLDSPYNRVADVKMLLFFAHPGRVTVAALGVLVIGSVLVRDLWCRYLCPYGALLGLIGRLAPLKVTRDRLTCTDCGKCTKVCPARLPVHAMKRVASVECTSCQDCVAVCPVKGCLAVRPRLPRRWPLLLRPAFAIVLAVAVYLAVTAAFRLSGHWSSAVTEGECAERLREIDSPIYTHVGGMTVTEPPGPSMVRAHAVR
jgi:polyferredoxin